MCCRSKISPDARTGRPARRRQGAEIGDRNRLSPTRVARRTRVTTRRRTARSPNCAGPRRASSARSSDGAGWAAPYIQASSASANRSAWRSSPTTCSRRSNEGRAAHDARSQGGRAPRTRAGPPPPLAIDRPEGSCAASKRENGGSGAKKTRLLSERKGVDG